MGSEFEYGLVKGGFKSESYIEVMNWVAQKAAQTLAETGKLTVVVQDNGSLHKSKVTQGQWAGWAEQGLILFFPALLLRDKSVRLWRGEAL